MHLSKFYTLFSLLFIYNLSAMQTASPTAPTTPSTNDVLRIVQKWFTPQNISSLGANGCMQKVELDLRNFATMAQQMQLQLLVQYQPNRLSQAPQHHQTI